MENSTVQEIAPDITLRWLHNKQIALFTIRTVDRSSWEAWQKTMMNLKGNWPLDRPFLTIQDNVFDKVASTPAVREYALQVGRFRPEVAQFSAVILPKNFVA